MEVERTALEALGLLLTVTGLTRNSKTGMMKISQVSSFGYGFGFVMIKTIFFNRKMNFISFACEL